jgi:hypothetical protein
MVKEKGNRGNTISTKELKLRTTPHALAYLDRLVSTGMYGKSPREAAEQLLRERLRQIFGEQEIVGSPPILDDETT